eukprot:CAMPEP_0114662424 /NCGR_PEP_ID=MMETSP0191-20121206/24823_1 /TAXON_ID=126664 /ORGANISM="Sorites sp." /LENGTH=71 /DNA_ID=CAMNT_0001898611 /DNA_START=815 /DNA_END=1030 /DNA_ORIENTATION=+
MTDKINGNQKPELNAMSTDATMIDDTTNDNSNDNQKLGSNAMSTDEAMMDTSNENNSNNNNNDMDGDTPIN